MRPVAIIGIGKTAFGAFPDRDLRSLAVEAGEKLGFLPGDLKEKVDPYLRPL